MKSIQQLMDLTGRHAVISGGAGQIAEAAAEALLEAGATVTLLDIDQEACQERAAELAMSYETSVSAHGCDLTDDDAIRNSIAEITSDVRAIDVIVHCAGVVGLTPVDGWAVPLEEQTSQAFEYSMRVNVVSAFVLLQAARASLAASGHGSVILFGSIYGSVGPDPRLYEGTDLENPVAYGATKGAVSQLTRHFATLLAPEIRVNAIAPGGLFRGQATAFVDRYEERTPLARMASAEDLKGAIAYLASDLSSYVTGHELLVDGGWMAW